MSYTFEHSASEPMPPPRISQKQGVVLDLLTTAGDAYGLELVRASDGRLKRGTVYVTLDRMEKKGLVESWEEEAPAGHRGPPRRKYRVTGLGEAALSTWRGKMRETFAWLNLDGPRLALLPVVGSPLGFDLTPDVLWPIVWGLSVGFGLGFASYVLFVYRERRSARHTQTQRFDQGSFPVDRPLRSLPYQEVKGFMYSTLVIESGKIADYAIRIIESDLEYAKQERDIKYILNLLASPVRLWIYMFRHWGSFDRGHKVSRPPATHLVGALRWVMPKRWVKRRIEQAYADELAEYYEALDNEERGRARWIRVRTNLILLKLVVISVPVGIWDHLVSELVGAFKSAD